MSSQASRVSLTWQRYKLMPYERSLAMREMNALLKPFDVRVSNDSVELRTRYLAEAERLTFFSHFKNGRIAGPTLQSLLEKTVGAGQPRRQQTRYSVHGLHEYKGKFNPQTAKALLNSFGLTRGARILDPFCGSGTTLIECIHNGFRPFGVDANPLAVFITNAKIAALASDPNKLSRDLRSLRSDSKHSRCRHKSAGDRRLRYLASWFTPEILKTIEGLREASAGLSDDSRAVFLSLASSLLREYSLQEPADLRIRRRRTPLPSVPFMDAFNRAASAFLVQLERTQTTVSRQTTDAAAINAEISGVSIGMFGRGIRGFDAAICSPPYATALPYIDTQRLSIVWLGLAQAPDLKTLEAQLTGNREISSRTRKHFESRLSENADTLPTEIADLCRGLQSAVGKSDGFRRVAVPALLYKYFVDMQAAFRSVSAALKRGAPFALVVGHNRTTLGGRLFDIATPELLATLGEAASFKVMEVTQLETYPRYGLHYKNAINAEALVVMRKT